MSSYLKKFIGFSVKWNKALRLNMETVRTMHNECNAFQISMPSLIMLMISRIVTWQNVLDSLRAVNEYLRSSCEEARLFMEAYMATFVEALLHSESDDVNEFERRCMEESSLLVLRIILKDLKIQIEKGAGVGDCKVLDSLAIIFDKKQPYYSELLPIVSQRVRIRGVQVFCEEGGFARLKEYFQMRVGYCKEFPLEEGIQITTFLKDAMSCPSPVEFESEKDDAVIIIAKIVTGFVSSLSQEQLLELREQVKGMLDTLAVVFDYIVVRRYQDTYEYYDFWRCFALKLIESSERTLQLFGWSMASGVAKATANHRPRARKFVVSGAGSTLVNGEYQYSSPMSSDGHFVPHVEATYVRRIPDGEDGGGKTLTLFRCTMLSQQKWWFLSEADEEQPGTDRDVDYYQRKTKGLEQKDPPLEGWTKCRSGAGVDPPPKLRIDGLIVPEGEKYDTLEHQLCQWIVDNRIVERVFGDSPKHEAVTESLPLLELLASMHQRDSLLKEGADTGNLSIFKLQESHLVLIFNAFNGSTNAILTLEIAKVLASILPSLPCSMLRGHLGNMRPLVSLLSESSEVDAPGVFFKLLTIVAKELPQKLKDGDRIVLDLLIYILEDVNQALACSNVNNVPGELIHHFCREGGFAHLAQCIAEETSAMFSTLDEWLQIVSALSFAIRCSSSTLPSNWLSMEATVISITNSAMDFVTEITESSERNELLPEFFGALRELFDHFMETDRKAAYHFYEFWRSVTLRLIKSESEPSLMLLGWRMTSDLIDACKQHQPPPRSYSVSGAGTPFVNGHYYFSGKVTKDGYVKPGASVSYTRTVGAFDGQGEMHKLFLARRSEGSPTTITKWALIKERFDGSGSKSYIHYYRHESPYRERKEPPVCGWTTCQLDSLPCPVFSQNGLLVPYGEEYNTLDHQLAKWLVDNRLLSHAIGEAVPKVIETSLEFLLSLCGRTAPVAGSAATLGLGPYCLQESHALQAWNACIGNVDRSAWRAVAEALGSMVLDMPSTIAAALLSAVQSSLRSEETLSKVGDFCRGAAKCCRVNIYPGFIFRSDASYNELLQLTRSFLARDDSYSGFPHYQMKQCALNILWLLQGLGRPILDFLDLSSLIKLASCSKWLQELIYKGTPALWSSIDFSDTVGDGRFGYARTRTMLLDKDVKRLLDRVNAVSVTKSISLRQCGNFSGQGLEPVRSSEVLESIDLRGTLAATANSSVVSEILCSMLPFNLTKVVFPSNAGHSQIEVLCDLRKEAATRAMISQSDMELIESSSILRMDSLALLPAIHCGECGCFVFQMKGTDDELAARFCNKCGAASCRDCTAVRHCDTCGFNFCNDCKSIMISCEICHTVNCWECKKAVFCSSCEKSFCEGCNDSLGFVTKCDGCNVQMCRGCSHVKQCSQCAQHFCGKCQPDDFDTGKGGFICEECSSVPTRRKRPRDEDADTTPV